MLTPEPPNAALDVFISYAREDRPTASKLAAALQARGISVWWDREILGGAEFSQVIEQELQRARVALVLWSEEAVRSSFVRDESARALAAGKLLPVRIKDVPPPLGFGQIHTLDLLDWEGDGDAPALAELIAHTERRLRGGAGPLSPGALRDRAMPNKRRTLLAGGAVAAAAGAAWFGWSYWFERDTARAQELTAGGVENLEKKEFDQARFRFNQALDADSEYAPALFYRAQVLVQSGAPQEATADLKRALELKRGLDDAQLRDARRWVAELAAQPSEPVPVTRVATAAQAETAPPPRVESPPPTAAASPASVAATPPSPTPASPPPPAPTRPSVDTKQPSIATAKLRPDAGKLGGATGGAVEKPVANPSIAAKAESAERHSLPLAGAALDELNAKVEQLFSPIKDARLAATTSLIVDPEATSDAVSLGVRRALQAQRNGVPKDPADLSGVINVLVVLQSATPSTLALHATDIRRLLDAARNNGPRTAEVVASVSAALARAEGQLPLVFIEIASEAQRALANVLAARLRGAAYRVPIAEVVGTRAPARTEIRVHGRSDKSLARWMARVVQETAGAPVVMQTLRNAKPKEDTFEIWLDAALCVAPDRKPVACGG